MKISKNQMNTIIEGVRAYDKKWGEHYKEMCIIWEDTDTTFEFIESNYTIVIDKINMTIEYSGIDEKIDHNDLLELVDEWED